MKVGLIAPIPHLAQYANGPFHLILSHILSEDTTYFEHYRQQALNGSWILLDNSAHEKGVGGDPYELVNQAIAVGARELVAPDVLFDSQGTVDLSLSALEVYQQNLRSELDRFQIQLMMVPQGENIHRWARCFQQLVKGHTRLFPGRKFTIGISKDYEIWEGGLANLISRYVEPLRNYMEFDVHLLGWGRRLYELSALSARFPWIRSTDSAKPFVYAYNNIGLTTDRLVPEYPTRPDRYFWIQLNEAQQALADQNIRVFQSRARMVEDERTLAN